MKQLKLQLKLLELKLFIFYLNLLENNLTLLFLLTLLRIFTSSIFFSKIEYKVEYQYLNLDKKSHSINKKNTKNDNNRI